MVKTYTLGAFHRCGASTSRSSYLQYVSRAAFSAPRTASKSASLGNLIW